MSFDPLLDRFDGARFLRERSAEMARLTERLRDPGREFREMQAGIQRQFEELRDPLRGLRESYRQIAEKFGLPPVSGFALPEPALRRRTTPRIIASEPERIITPEPSLRLIEGGLATKPRRGRPIGYVASLTRAAMLVVDFYFEALDLASKSDPAARVMLFEDAGLVDDPPRSVLGISRAAADLACKHGLPDSEALDPEGHTMKAAVQARLTARNLVAAARPKAAD